MLWKASISALALATALSGAAYAVTDEDFAKIRQAIKQLEKRRAEDEARIEELERRLKEAQADAQAAKTSAAQAQAQAQAAPPPSAASPAPTPSGTPASNNAFNPAIGVVLMGNYANFGRDPKNAPIPGFALGDDASTLGDRGFSLAESEVNLSANIDPTLYGEITLSFPRTGSVDVEEGFIQTTGLPYGFTAKAGRFFSAIGYLNEFHSHAWDFIDAPLPYRAMLNNQLGDEGAQLRWLAPTDQYLQFGVEALRGDKFPATPTNDGVGAQSAFVRAGGDVGIEHSWLASAAFYHADAKNRATDSDLFTGTDNLGIAGLVWKWAPDGNPVQRNLKLQGEFFYRQEDGTFNGIDDHGHQTGWYAQTVYQFMPQWKIGARYDQVEASKVSSALAGSTLDNLGRTPRRYSGLLEYDTSEFGRFRLQYNRDESAPKSNDIFQLNYTVTFGSHGAHQY